MSNQRYSMTRAIVVSILTLIMLLYLMVASAIGNTFVLYGPEAANEFVYGWRSESDD